MAASTEWAVAVNNVARYNPSRWLIAGETITCKRCGVPKPPTSFKQYRSGTRSRVCRACHGIR